MKKKRIRRSGGLYRIKPGTWIMLMLLCAVWLPALMKSVFMILIRQAIPLVLVILSDFTGWLVAWFMFYKSVRAVDGYRKLTFRRTFKKVSLKSGLWIAAIMFLSNAANTAYLDFGTSIAIKGNSTAYLAGQGAIMLLTCLFLAPVIFRVYCITADAGCGESYVETVLKLFRSPLLYAGAVFSAFTVIYIIPLLYDSIIYVLPLKSASFLTVTGGAVLISLMLQIVIQPVLKGFSLYSLKLAGDTKEIQYIVQVQQADEGILVQGPADDSGNSAKPGQQEVVPSDAGVPKYPGLVQNKAEAFDAQSVDAQSVDAQSVDAQSVDVRLIETGMNTARQGPAAKYTGFAGRHIPVIAAIVVAIVSGGYLLASAHPFTAISSVRRDIDYYLDQSHLLEMAGDHSAAVYYLDIAEARILAWQGAVLDKAGTLKQALNLAPGDGQVLLLNAMKSPEKLLLLEKGLMEDAGCPVSWYLVLLKSYRDIQSPNESEKQRMEDLLRICIVSGYFSYTEVKPEDIPAGMKDDFSKMLAGFSERLEEGRGLK